MPLFEMSLKTEMQLLAIWAHILPPLTILLSVGHLFLHHLPSHHILSDLRHRQFIALLPLIKAMCGVIALLCWVYLAVSTRLLAVPIYVCFYPVRGEDFHHPEEVTLGIQWKLYALAALLWLIGLGMGTYVGFGRAMLTKQGVAQSGKMRFDGAGEEKEYTKKMRRLEERWRTLDTRKFWMMITAIVVGFVGWSAMWGRSRDSWSDTTLKRLNG